MRWLLSISLCFLFSLCVVAFVSAQSVERVCEFNHQFDSWTPIGDKVNLTFDRQVKGRTYIVYLGFMEDRQNPDNAQERVHIVQRYLPFWVAWNQKPSRKNSYSPTIQGYTTEQKDKILAERYTNSDLIGFTLSTVSHDVYGRTITTIERSFLVDAFGRVAKSGAALQWASFSEVVDGKNQLVGFKFWLGEDENIYHIIRISPYDISSGGK